MRDSQGEGVSGFRCSKEAGRGGTAYSPHCFAEVDDSGPGSEEKLKKCYLSGWITF